jgi:hypothetical protein
MRYICDALRYVCDAYTVRFAFGSRSRCVRVAILLRLVRAALTSRCVRVAFAMSKLFFSIFRYSFYQSRLTFPTPYPPSPLPITGVSKTELENSPVAQKVLTDKVRKTVMDSNTDADDVEVKIKSITDKAAVMSTNKKRIAALGDDLSIAFNVKVTYATVAPDVVLTQATIATAINTQIQSGNMTTALSTSGVDVFVIADVPKSQEVAVAVVDITGPGTVSTVPTLNPTLTPTLTTAVNVNSGGFFENTTRTIVAIIVAAILVLLLLSVAFYFFYNPSALTKPKDQRIYPGYPIALGGEGGLPIEFADFRVPAKVKPGNSKTNSDEVDEGAEVVEKVRFFFFFMNVFCDL